MNRKFKISRITLLLMCLCLVFLFSCGEENEKNEVRVETEIVPTSECETIFSQGINVSSEGEPGLQFLFPLTRTGQFPLPRRRMGIIGVQCLLRVVKLEMSH